MARNTLLAILLLSLVNGCSCDEVLYKTCPEARPCSVSPDGGFIIYEDGDDIPGEKTLGECQLGHTECDEDYADICVGNVGPQAEECDGLDNDCNGILDNGLSYDFDGDSYNSADSCLNNTDCDDTSDVVFPGNQEVCDGLDNDCDGEIDDIGPFECWTGADETAFGGSSPCKTGVVSCIDGAWGGCEGQVTPTPEQCDLIDNNCNGIVDDNPEMEGTPCGPANETGQCSYGHNVCVEGEMYCIGATHEQNEACDGLDNDCNGFVDESLERLCQTECGYGIETCEEGDWINCSAQTPQIEICDMLDNDCDGEVDEGCLCIVGDSRTCQEENMYDPVTGESKSCGLGIQYCDLFGVWGQCFWTGISPEVCNAWDDDCDGVIDMMETTCGVQEAATVGVGECRLGSSTCEEGEWGPCLGEVGPTEEVCDQLDNDCDGETDEDLNSHEKVDMVFAIDISGSMCSYIYALTQGISAYVADFAETEHRFGLVVFPPPGNSPSGAYQPRYEVITIPPLVDVTSFLFQLSVLDCDGGGMEPSYDTLYDLVLPGDPAGIGWRNDAYPYIVVITDEIAQSWDNLGQSQISPHTNDCQLGECVPGDKIEIFVISKGYFVGGWDAILYGELDRYYEIHPPDGSRYAEILKDIFENVCLPEGE
jgi:hypothetical protein